MRTCWTAAGNGVVNFTRDSALHTQAEAVFAVMTVAAWHGVQALRVAADNAEL
jgi:Ni,Fe-hydrogenase I small subunit